MQCKKVGNRICTFIWYFRVCTAYCRPPSKRHLSYNVIRIPSNSRISRGETSRTCQIQCLMIELDQQGVWKSLQNVSFYNNASEASYVYVHTKYTLAQFDSFWHTIRKVKFLSKNSTTVDSLFNAWALIKIRTLI